MDSGNSNSMQSSSGGDEEYDSRADSISSFLNNNSSSYTPPPAPAPAQQQEHHHLHHPSLFDHLSSNYNFDPISQSSSSRLSSSLPLNTSHHPNSLLNLDMVWSKSLRSEPNCTDLGGLFVPSSSSSATAFPALHVSPRGGGTESVSSKASSFLAAASGPGLNIDQAHINLNNNNSNHHSTMMVRNPKKRSRASRRAPTTVLTTDTTNFRAMVQEFTGIPAPPFTSSHFPRTRFDLFGTSSSTSSSLMMRSTIGSHLDSSPPPPPSSYNLLRPFAQKLINPSSFSTTNNSSVFIDAIASASTSSTNASATTTTTNINYQQLPSHHQNLFGINMQNSNPILNLHSLLQVPPKYPLANSPILETKPPPPQGSSLEELGLSHVAAASASHLNTNLMSGLQSLVSSSANNDNPTSWHGHGAGTGATAAVGSNENEEATAGLFANGKLNSFSQASSEFHRDKGQESVNVVATTTRTEGMVESWICSSD